MTLSSLLPSSSSSISCHFHHNTPPFLHSPSNNLALRPLGQFKCAVRPLHVTSIGAHYAKKVAPSSSAEDGALADEGWMGLIGRALHSSLLLVAALSFSFSGIGPAEARPEGVNRPELLPKEFTPLIDVAGFLSEGQEVRIIKDIKRLEDDTGFKLRVLAQNYPNTPGLAVKDFWQVDDSTIVFVADPTMGNILNFNVGAAVDLNVPRSFWSRLAGVYGNIFYWREKGEDSSIEAAVSAIDTCLREPQGPYACSDIK